jgi:hypothetical protein
MSLTRSHPPDRRNTHKHAFGRLLLPILSFIPLLAAAGCFPKNVLWLPDSSGIIYTDKESTRIVRYDLAKQSRKMIVENTNTKTPWPAISPDGRTVAVLKELHSGKKNSYITTIRHQVVIYDLDGTEVSRSKEFTSNWTNEKPNLSDSDPHLVESALIWSSLPDKILLAGGIYDCRHDKWIATDVFPCPFNNHPNCPNKTGFLAFAKDRKGKGVGDNPSRLVFVDWDGWVAEFKNAPTDLLSTKRRPLGFSWETSVASLVFADTIVDLDTATKECSQKPHAISVLADGDGEIGWTYEFKTGGHQVCLFEFKGGKPEYSLEVQIRSSQKRKLLLNKGEFSIDTSSFFPSPDGDKVAVRCVKRAQEREQDTIIVIDNKGEVVASISPD